MWRIAIVLLLGAGMACASSLGLPNELVNGGFEKGDLTGWEVSGIPPEVLPGPWFNGLLPPEGEFFAGWAASYGTKNGTIYQIIPVDKPGPYIIDVSGWVYVWNLGGAPGDTYIDVVITADGNEVSRTSFEADPQNPGNEGWRYFEIITEQPVWVERYKDIHIEMHQLWGIEWNIGAVDGLDVEEILIPEPGTIALLLTGLTGLAGIAALRRR